MKIIEINLETSMLDAQMDFYGNKLKLRIDNSAVDGFSFFTNHTKINFTKAANNHPFYHFAFNIPSNKIDEAILWLGERTTLLWLSDFNSHVAEFTNWNARSVYFMDPAGNIVEFIAMFDLQDFESAKFSEKQIRCVSEIGLVFPKENFDDGCTSILSAFPLSYFSKQPPLDIFRAMGNDEGMFICVPDGRPWYPTSKNNASVFPIRISFEQDGKTYSYSS